jgi:hypothetical protein
MKKQVGLSVKGSSPNLGSQGWLDMGKVVIEGNVDGNVNYFLFIPL